MANPNFTPSWPLYKDADGAYVSALPIKAIKYANDGSASAEFDGPYADQYMSAQTVAYSSRRSVDICSEASTASCSI